MAKKRQKKRNIPRVRTMLNAHCMGARIRRVGTRYINQKDRFFLVVRTLEGANVSRAICTRRKRMCARAGHHAGLYIQAITPIKSFLLLPKEFQSKFRGWTEWASGTSLDYMLGGKDWKNRPAVYRGRQTKFAHRR